MKTLLILSTVIFCFTAGAVEYRAGVIGRKFSATEMNDALISQNLKPIYQMPGLNLEADVEPISRVHFGLRWEGYHIHVGDGKSTTLAADPGFSEVNADVLEAILRWTVIGGSPFRVDLFGGTGGISGGMKFKAANGTEYNQQTRGLDMRAFNSAGLSIAIGKPSSFCVTFEGGYEWASLGSLSRDEGTTPVVNRIDLTGPFAAIGVMFIPGGSVSSGGKSK